jgi:hypothetical protein
MATYKNTSDQVFQDGDLMVAPGEEVKTTEQFRKDQFEGLYRWQFDKTSDKDEESNEAELKERGAGNVRELRDGDHVELDAEGNQAKKVGK